MGHHVKLRYPSRENRVPRWPHCVQARTSCPVLPGEDPAVNRRRPANQGVGDGSVASVGRGELSRHDSTRGDLDRLARRGVAALPSGAPGDADLAEATNRDVPAGDLAADRGEDGFPRSTPDAALRGRSYDRHAWTPTTSTSSRFSKGVKQFVAPAYQRRYTWTQPQWESLWRQVLRQHQALVDTRDAHEAGLQLPSLSTHFLGSFVLAPLPGPAAQITRHQIVDGQQRLTTISVLLAAIRDVVSVDAPHDGERIDNTYLVNQYKQGEDRSKILLTAVDRADLIGVTLNRPAAPTGRIGSAYQYFRNRIEVTLAGDAGLDLTDLETAVVTRLAVVEITAGGTDSVHRIFQTLNSSGVRLEQVDLLRNHFFMLLPSQADAIYESLWLPMEAALGQAGLDDFFFTDLVRRRGGSERYARHDVYPSYQEELEPIENDEQSVIYEIEAVNARAEVYRQIGEPALAEQEEIRHRLSRLHEWGTATTGPLLLELLLRVSEERISTSDAERALLYIESFLVRRLLLRIPTNNLNRIFSELPASLPAEGDVADALRQALSIRGRYWPTDEDIKARITSEEFYKAQRPAQRQFVLRRLEEALPHEVPPNWAAATLTIEHVMPQTLTNEWCWASSEMTSVASLRVRMSWAAKSPAVGRA